MLKENDFIEITYTAKLKESGDVFDTTDQKVAKENKIDRPNAKYGSLVICLGQGQVLKGLDSKLIGKDIGEHTVELSAEEAFGKKQAKLVTMIPNSKFKDQKIKPFPGLQINVDDAIGTVKMVSGGRIIVDFNHPLSGKALTYIVQIKRIVKEDQEKVSSIIKSMLGIDKPKLEKAENGFTILLEKDLPKELKKIISEKIIELTGVKNIQIKEDKPLNKGESKKE